MLAQSRSRAANLSYDCAPMDAWWLVLAGYWGVSFGLLGQMYAEAERADPQPGDWLTMLTVGPLVLAWICASRLMRKRR